MGAQRLYNELNALGFPVTFAEAKDLFKKYVDTYGRAIKYLRYVGEKASLEGYLTNMNGRRRYWKLPEKDDPNRMGILASIKREGGNYVISSVNADLTKTSMIKIRELVKTKGLHSEITNQVYDEVVTHTPQDESEDFVRLKRQIMRDAAKQWLKKVPMEVDGHVGPCWHKD